MKPSLAMLLSLCVAGCQPAGEVYVSTPSSTVCELTGFSNVVFVGRIQSQEPAAFPGWSAADNASRVSVAFTVDEVLLDRHVEALDFTQPLRVVNSKAFMTGGIAKATRVVGFLSGVSGRYLNAIGEQLFYESSAGVFVNDGLYGGLTGPTNSMSEAELRAEVARGSPFDWMEARTKCGCFHHPPPPDAGSLCDVGATSSAAGQSVDGGR